MQLKKINIGRATDKELADEYDRIDELVPDNEADEQKLLEYGEDIEREMCAREDAENMYPQDTPHDQLDDLHNQPLDY